MNDKIESELRKLYNDYFKGNFYKFKHGGFTSVGDENGVHITMLYMHHRHEMCINYPGYSNHWHSVHENTMDKVFEDCINEAKTKAGE